MDLHDIVQSSSVGLGNPWTIETRQIIVEVQNVQQGTAILSLAWQF
jgi:hypothetical protein